MKKPSLFIGSSSEGLSFARAIRGKLEDSAEVTLWEDGFFSVGKTFIESLTNLSTEFDFAILVFTGDDLVTSRNEESFGPRDNVIFELGLFMGVLGRERCFIIHQSNTDIKIPSDLAGITTAKYHWPREDKSHERSVGSACDAIRKIIIALGLNERKTQKKLDIVETEQLNQKMQIEALSFVIRYFVPKFEIEHLKNLIAEKPFNYQMCESFQREVRHLLDLHFIEKRYAFPFASLPPHGNLNDYFQATELGTRFLQMQCKFN